MSDNGGDEGESEVCCKGTDWARSGGAKKPT